MDICKLVLAELSIPIVLLAAQICAVSPLFSRSTSISPLHTPAKIKNTRKGVERGLDLPPRDLTRAVTFNES